MLHQLRDYCYLVVMKGIQVDQMMKHEAEVRTGIETWARLEVLLSARAAGRVLAGTLTLDELKPCRTAPPFSPGGSGLELSA